MRFLGKFDTWSLDHVGEIRDGQITIKIKQFLSRRKPKDRLRYELAKEIEPEMTHLIIHGDILYFLGRTITNRYGSYLYSASVLRTMSLDDLVQQDINYITLEE